MRRKLRILVLTKRQYMSRDLITDRFGRFRELPLGLSRCDAEVTGVCLSYRSLPEQVVLDQEEEGRVEWHSLNLWRLAIPGPGNLLSRIRTIAGRFRPDVIWAGSDALNVTLGAIISRRLSATFVADLYDNFESYGAASIPGLTRAFHWALGRADMISAISGPLAEKIRRQFPTARVEILSNAVPKGRFHPRDRAECRRSLGLPEHAQIVGLAGAISDSRGIQALWDAVGILRIENPNLYLVMAGPVDRSLSLPASAHDIYLGMLPQDSVALLVNALDVAVICNRNSEFGKYCFPQKLFEYCACGVPIVAADVGSISELLAGYPSILYAADDSQGLADALRSQLSAPIRPKLDVPSWQDLAARLHGMISRSHIPAV